MDKGYLIFDFRLKESQEIKHWFSDLMCGMIAFHTYKTICLFIFKYLFLKYEVREVVYVFQVQALRIWHVVCEDAVYSLKTKVKLDLITTKFSLFSTGFQSARDTLMCSENLDQMNAPLRSRETACTSALLTLPVCSQQCFMSMDSIIWLRIK